VIVVVPGINTVAPPCTVIAPKLIAPLANDPYVV